ncbi:MAG: PIG-L family deacetylase [Pyrinomonadaceae bacterium]
MYIRKKLMEMYLSPKSQIIVLFAVVVLVFIFPVQAQVRPVYDLGAIGFGQQLKRMQTTASAMHIAAHPDDEDSGLMAYLARKEQARTAYLALNRGDGGQNVIGQELFEALGVIRTEELLQARRLDGGTQFFTRVMDYGFSKKREEAASIWGEREVLGDMVRAIRMHRPLVVISRFSGTPADGHGQHQLAGYLSPLAFKLAADPNEFPEQIRDGLRPWKALKFYVSQSFFANPQNAPTLLLNTGEYDTLIGRSYYEIAAEGRSQHKSQEMGSLELRGQQTSGMRLVESAVGRIENEQSIFDGIDTSIKGIAKLTSDDRVWLAEKLADLQVAAESALSEYDPNSPEKLLPILANGHRLACEAEQATRNPASMTLLREKRVDFAKALQMASGVVVDSLIDNGTVTAGNTENVAVRVFAPKGSSLVIKDTVLNLPAEWGSESVSEPAQPAASGFRPRRESPFAARYFRISVPSDARPTQPYWLYSARKNFNFDWSAAGAARNLPFQAPLVTATVRIDVAGEEIEITSPVQYRYADDIRGEIRREAVVVPAITIGLESNQIIVPASIAGRTRKLMMTVTNNSKASTSGRATFDVPDGWELFPRSADFELKRPGDMGSLSFELKIPVKTVAGEYRLAATAAANGVTFRQQVQEIAYPHIQTHRIYSNADVIAHVLDVKTAAVKIGYIMGTGDRVPEAILNLGLDVSLLEEKDLSTGNLSLFDTIVVGIRASQVRPDYVANNGRLTTFMNNGGTLIVQYQQQEFVRQNLPPFPAKMDGNSRVVDEKAEVRILKPQHSIFNFPNKINEDDFKNWIQERNLYSFSDFGPEYTPLLESHDEGEKEGTGGMVHAFVGKGNFLYTSYSWFRQLPNGNPGAYRIFANMLSLPKAK